MTDRSGPDGYCAICYHALDLCSHCDQSKQLADLVTALDAYFAAKGSWNDAVWLAALNELIAAQTQARAVLAEGAGQ